MPLKNIDYKVENKENEQQVRKRRASEGSVLKPKPVFAVHDNQQESHSDSHWKRLFMSLQQERVTVAERQLYNLMEESEKREESLKNYIRHLESDLVDARNSLKEYEIQANHHGQVQEKLDDAEMRMEVMKVELSKLHDQVEAKDRTNRLLSSTISERENSIQIYKMLTQTQVSTGNDGIIECCVTNSSRESAPSTTFCLRKLTDETMMEYQPVENVEPLPSFLHEPIEFETAECPILMQKILNGVFPDEK